ncbi:hypothetical protein SUGI_0491410 [Cryptomeria japonica]|uniref:cytochrome P450 94A2 n=1 Tax=Cryptomeria japonica TaxID=3369 RepID=UPI002408CF39|nr:cytochrome P450 94A2 [Cryptomeria japonica]GLJ25653.1 hypothetical protein SUGI_0491410 [Cryptomeria japonica]
MAEFFLDLLLPCVSLLIGIFFLLQLLFHGRKKSKSENPTLLPFFGILFPLIKNRHRFHDWITELLSASPSNTFKNHRLGGTKGYFTANPANLEHVLKTNFENYRKGERLNFILHDFLGRGIFNANGDLWKMQRKVASYEFNTKSLRNFVVETVQSEIQERLIPVLSKACNEGISIDLQDVLQRFTFDNICRVAFGADPAYLDPSLPQLPLARIFGDATELSFARFLYGMPFLWRIKRALNLGSERRLRRAIREVDDFAMNLIRARRKEIAESQLKGSDSPRNDLLSRFMAAANEFETETVEDEEKHKSDVFLRDMIVNFVLAGRDTSSTSLTWFFWVLSSHPRVESAIRHEILQILSKRKVEMEAEPKGGLNISFTYEELREMQYLHAAVCESLRLYPPVPLGSKSAVQDDILPDGSFVGKGWSIDYSIYAMGRMESIWGADCLEFKPERWFVNGEFVAENPYKFSAFHAGPRICLGKEMAFIQMKSTVASILHSFSLGVDQSFVPTYAIDFTMRMKGGMRVTVRKR